MEMVLCRVKKTLQKGAWSLEEDKKLMAYIKKYGIWIWSEMPGPAGLSRSGKSCRLRWMNYLRPGIKHGNFSRDEEETILKLHEQLGNRWSAIAARLPQRTDNEIKNYWHSRLKKRLTANLAPTTELQGEKTSGVEANQQNPSEIDLVLPNSPKATNSEDSNAISLSSSNSAVYIDNNQALNEIIGSSESLGEVQSLWEQPFPMEDLNMMEDYGTTYTDPGFIAPTSPMWLQEPIYPCACYNDADNDFWVKFFMQEYMDGI